MNTNPQPEPGHQQPSAEDAAVSARRLAILRGLGKGGVALAALSPVVGHATRAFKVPNPELPAPSFGYCTVSGFQSAAISGSPAAVQCGAFEPKDFVAPAIPLTYDTLIASYAPTAAGTYEAKLAAALNAYYGAGAGLTETLVTSTVRATLATRLLVSSLTTKAVIVPGMLRGVVSRTGGTELRATASFPATVVPTAAFNAIFTSSSDNRPLLEVLQDGVSSANPTSANCYVLAAYLSVGMAGATLPPSVTRAYIVSQYTATGYGSTTNLYKFFRQLCIS